MIGGFRLLHWYYIYKHTQFSTHSIAFLLPHRSTAKPVITTISYDTTIHPSSCARQSEAIFIIYWEAQRQFSQAFRRRQFINLVSVAFLLVRLRIIND